MNVVVLQWHYNERDGKAIVPELNGTFGPFPDREDAEKWITAAPFWTGWGSYEYQIQDLVPPEEV